MPKNVFSFLLGFADFRADHGALNLKKIITSNDINEELQLQKLLCLSDLNMMEGMLNKDNG